MKKNFFFWMAAIVMLIMSSCQQEAGFGTEATVSFQVGTPEIATRAYSDGTTATVLQYAVYDNAGNILDKLTVTDGEIHGSTTVNLQLTTGNTYSVIFWAAEENAPYTVDFANKTMTVDYTNAVSNAENLDAFYKHHTFTVTGAQTEIIELRRPFAQLNIGTNDYEASEKAGYEPKYSSVKVSNVYNTLDLVEGNVSGATAVVYSYNVIPTNETFPVAGYEYLAMNYLLVASDKEVVDVEFGYTELDATAAKTRTVGSVPVQRNHRTNIYGQLLTSDVDVNVIIEPEYEEPAYEAEELFLAAAVGGEVTLTEDVVLTEPLKVQNNVTINLNGKTISAEIAKGNDAAVIEVAEGVIATLEGGKIESTVTNGAAAINNKGELVLKNIEIVGAPIADGSHPEYAVSSSGKLVIEEGANIKSDRGCLRLTGDGETVINGGLFTNNDIAPRTLTSHVVYVAGTHKLTIEGGEFKHLHTATSGGVVICNMTAGIVYVNGGNFSGGNYFAGQHNLSDYGCGGTFAVTGGIYSAKPADKYLADGYKAVDVNGLFYVLPEAIADAADVANVTTVTESTTDIATALATDNGEVTMFMWNDVAYIAKYGEVVIASSAEEATTVRGVVEGSTSLKSATVSEGVEVVGNRTFRKCAELETVVLPNNLVEIGPAVFQSCSKLANVTIPATVQTIGEGAFAECVSLTSINIPDGITRLEKDVLRNTGLTSIEIPASVNYIGTYAFRDCEALTEVKILSSEFTIENNTFTNMAAPVPTMTIKVVNEEMKAYLESVLTNYDKSYITVVVM